MPIAPTYPILTPSPFPSGGGSGGDADTLDGIAPSGFVQTSGTQTVGGAKTFTSDVVVPAEAYGAGWNGSNEAATKNDTYDAIEALPDITSGDTDELIVGVDGTLTIGPGIRRVSAVRAKLINHYFVAPADGPLLAAAVTQSRMHLVPVWLRAGVIDRIGWEIATGVGSAVGRYGIYPDLNGEPDLTNIIVDSGGTTQDLSGSAGWGTPLTISATLPTSGRYWLAGVSQGAAANVRLTTGQDPLAKVMSRGTSLPASSSTGVTGMHVSGVTGALPTSGTLLYANTTWPIFILRYSS